MSSEPDRASEELRRRLLAVYNSTVVDHIQRPRNTGVILDPDGFARSATECGDMLEIGLRVVDGRIEDIKVRTYGCAATMAAGSMVTELARGRSVIEAARIRQQHVLDALGGLPPGNQHCALLAANTLNEAIRDYLAYKNEPWKRVYRSQ